MERDLRSLGARFASTSRLSISHLERFVLWPLARSDHCPAQAAVSQLGCDLRLAIIIIIDMIALAAGEQGAKVTSCR